MGGVVSGGTRAAARALPARKRRWRRQARSPHVASGPLHLVAWIRHAKQHARHPPAVPGPPAPRLTAARHSSSAAAGSRHPVPGAPALTRCPPGPPGRRCTAAAAPRWRSWRGRRWPWSTAGREARGAGGWKGRRQRQHSQTVEGRRWPWSAAGGAGGQGWGLGVEDWHHAAPAPVLAATPCTIRTARRRPHTVPTGARLPPATRGRDVNSCLPAHRRAVRAPC